MRHIIRNVSVFDGSGSPAAPATVVVEADRVVAVAPSAEPIAAQSADVVIDGRGGTLMPGMVDAHAHLSWGSSVEKIYHQFMLPPDELKVATWRNARVLLDHGFTSLYSAGALAETIEVELRDEIRSGKTPGPRLIASTIERSPEGLEGVETGNVDHGRGPEAMRAFVAHCKAIGIDSIKLIVSGEDALKPQSAMNVLYTAEEMRAAGEAAQEAGLWIATHTYSTEAVRMALGAGARILYHCSFIDEAGIDALEAHKDKIFYAPGPGVSVGALEASPPPHIDMSHMKASAAERLEVEAKLVPELKRRGVRVLIGGDYGFPFNPNGTNARDLQHFVNHYSYTPAEALSAATMLGGQLMGMGDELGLVRPGFIADLLLVDGDPTKDLGVLLDQNRIRMIMQGGRLYKAPPSLHAAA
jgi:imidazolonepropionase-like amidohydrolase